MAFEHYGPLEIQSEIMLLYAGSQACTPQFSGWGMRDHYFLHYILSGRGTAKIGQKSHQLKKGCGFFILPWQTYHYQASTEDPWHYAWLGFTGEKALEIIQELRINQKETTFSGTYSKELEQSLLSLSSEIEHRRSGYRLKAKGLFYHIMGEICRIQQEGVPKETIIKPSEPVERILSFINFNFQRPINVTTIVNHLGYNRSYLFRLFREYTGKSIQAYLMEFRMKKAEEYLLTTQMPIHAIASSVGYPQYYGFARQFKQFYQMTPGELRKKGPNNRKEI